MLWKGSHMTRSPAGALSTRCWESFSPWHKWKVYILILKSKFNKVSLKLQTRTKCGTSATRAGPQSTGYVTRHLRGQREEQEAFPWQHTLKITKEDVRRLKATVSFKQIACWLVEQLWKSPSNRMSNSLSFSKIFLLVFHIPKIRQIKNSNATQWLTVQYRYVNKKTQWKQTFTFTPRIRLKIVSSSLHTDVFVFACCHALGLNRARLQWCLSHTLQHEVEYFAKSVPIVLVFKSISLQSVPSQ